MRLRERLAPLLVIGVVVGTALGVLTGGSVPDLNGATSAPVAGVEFAPSSAAWPTSRSDLDVADLRTGSAQPADALRNLGAAGHTGPAVLDSRSSPPVGTSRTGQPPAAVRLVLEAVAPRLGRAPPNIRVS